MVDEYLITQLTTTTFLHQDQFYETIFMHHQLNNLNVYNHGIFRYGIDVTVSFTIVYKLIEKHVLIFYKFTNLDRSMPWGNVEKVSYRPLKSFKTSVSKKLGLLLLHYCLLCWLHGANLRYQHHLQGSVINLGVNMLS